MNHRILIQVTAPAVVIGLLLFGACLVSAWYINRLQTNISTILSQNVTSLCCGRRCGMVRERRDVARRWRV